MYKNLVTIVIPVRESPKIIDRFIEGNINILRNCRVITINSHGGEELMVFGKYIYQDVSMIDARKMGYELVTTSYILNLDADNVLPEGYIDEALDLLKEEKVAVISLDFERCMGHLGFGASLWKTEILKKLYNYKRDPDGKLCECIYMWRRVTGMGYKIETLPKRVKHLRG